MTELQLGGKAEQTTETAERTLKYIKNKLIEGPAQKIPSPLERKEFTSACINAIISKKENLQSYVNIIVSIMQRNGFTQDEINAFLRDRELGLITYAKLLYTTQMHLIREGEYKKAEELWQTIEKGKISGVSGLRNWVADNAPTYLATFDKHLSTYSMLALRITYHALSTLVPTLVTREIVRVTEETRKIEKEEMKEEEEEERLRKEFEKVERTKEYEEAKKEVEKELAKGTEAGKFIDKLINRVVADGKASQERALDEMAKIIAIVAQTNGRAPSYREAPTTVPEAFRILNGGKAAKRLKAQIVDYAERLYGIPLIGRAGAAA